MTDSSRQPAVQPAPRHRLLLAALLGAPMTVGALIALPLSVARAQNWTGPSSGSVDFNNAGNWDGTIDSSSIAVINGTPTLTFSGANGNVNVDRLQLGTANGANVSATFSGGAQLTIGTGLTLSAVAGATSSLTLTGSGTSLNAGSTIILSNAAGANTATLRVEDGATVTAGTTLTVGTGTSGNATLVITGAGSTLTATTTASIGLNTATGAVTLSDGGTLSVTGGTLTMTNNAGGTATLNIGAASGQAAAAAGTLSATTLSFGIGTSTVVFNHTNTNYSFSTLFAGSNAGQVKHEAGTTTLTGTSTNTAMTTAVSGGSLYITGQLLGTTTVSGSGALGGTGTLGTVVVNSGGVVNPGGASSIGTLNAGNTTFNSGSKLKIDGSGSAMDRLTVTGTLTINSGATLELSPAVGFTAGSYQVASASGGVTGTFSTVTVSGSGSMTANMTYNSNNILAALQASSSGNLPGSASSAGGKAAGAALDSLRGNAQMNNLIAVLDGLSSEQKATALNGLSGQQVAALTAPVDAAGNVLGSVMNHSGLSAGTSSPVASAGQRPGNSTGVSTGERPELRGLWLNGIGGFGSTDGKNGTAGTNTSHGGMAGGIDFPVMEDRLTIGVAGGYVGSRTDIDNNGGNAESEAGFVGLYGRYELDNGIRLDGTAMAGYHSGEHDRRIQLGTASQTAHGDYDGYSTGGSLQVSKGFDVNDTTAVRPFAGVTAQRYWQDGYTETGAGTANLKYDDMTSDSVVSRVGAAVEFDTVIADHRVLPTVSLGWAHTFSDATQMDAAFALAPGSRFTTQGAQMDRDALEVGVSAEILGRDNAYSLIAGYGGSFASDAQDHSFSLRAKMAF